MIVGYLANAFDLLNVRDLDLIAQARQHCSRLVVGVLSDDFAELLYGRRPVVPMVERVALVSQVRGVHEVVVHDDTTRAADLGSRVFAVADDAPMHHFAQTWLLTPTRETASLILRDALALVSESDDELHAVA